MFFLPEGRDLDGTVYQQPELTATTLNRIMETRGDPVGTVGGEDKVP